MFQYSKAEAVLLPVMLILIIAICIALGFALKNKSTKIKRIPQLIIAVLVVGLEIVKQTIHIANGTYSAWYIPLHFCSLFIFFYALAEFFSGKVREIGQSLAFTCSFMFVALFYFQPSGVIGSAASDVFGSFNNFHTFFYHHLVILYFGLTIALKTYSPKLIHIFYVFLGLTIYFVVGVSFAFMLNTNYCNFLFSVIDFIEALRLQVGQVLYLAGMYVFGIGLACMFMWLCNVFKEHCTANKIKKASACIL